MEIVGPDEEKENQQQNVGSDPNEAFTRKADYRERKDIIDLESDSEKSDERRSLLRSDEKDKFVGDFALVKDKDKWNEESWNEFFEFIGDELDQLRELVMPPADEWGFWPSLEGGWTAREIKNLRETGFKMTLGLGASILGSVMSFNSTAEKLPQDVNQTKILNAVGDVGVPVFSAFAGLFTFYDSLQKFRTAVSERNKRIIDEHLKWLTQIETRLEVNRGKKGVIDSDIYQQIVTIVHDARQRTERIRNEKEAQLMAKLKEREAVELVQVLTGEMLDVEHKVKEKKPKRHKQL